VFLSFVFWAWLLGGPGAFLALPITLFVAVMFDTFPETRWLAGLIGVSGAQIGAADSAAPDATIPDAEAESEL
jgi:predicted PurR-regulated permease PerM